MRVIEKTVFLFEELSDKAKEKAREWYRLCDDGEFAEGVIEDAKIIGEKIGIDINKIYYSGFWSQGDGACFEGYYSYKKGWKKELLAYANDPKVFSIAQRLQDAQKAHFFKLDASCKQRGHYQHSGCMTVNVEHSDDRYRDIQDAESDVTDLLREFADWIYASLEKEWEYQNSDSVVDENITANEYEFDENGKRA